jgi:hypothetical protein
MRFFVSGRCPVADRLKLISLSGLLALGAACAQGEIQATGSASTGAAGSGSMPPAMTGTAGTGTGVPVVPPGNDPNNVLSGVPKAGAFTPAVPTLRRLTVAQYKNSIRDLLPGASVKTDLEADTALDGLASVGASRIALSPTATEQFETAALDVAHQALSNTATRGALVGCTPAGMTDDACARTFITKFGRRAWRRDLTADEITKYAGLATNASGMLKDFWAGLEYGLAGVLQSPHFLYREELGAADPADSSRRLYTGYELASRLSYLILNTTPDDTLLDAAKAGKLSTAAGLGAEAQRLAASPAAREAMGSFFAELYQLSELDNLPQLPAAFPALTPTLPAAMRTETMKVIDELAMGGDNDFRNLFDTTTTYVNGELAKLYGIPGITGTNFVKTTLPESGPRAGFLGHASFLSMSSHADSGSPTRRGKFIREVLLCRAVPAAPPEVDTTFPSDPPNAPKRTTRQKLEVHRTAGASCATCHSMMDPIGLGLENFDGIGAYRTMEVGQTIDASGNLDGVAFTDARGLGAALKNHKDLGTCVARGLHRYAVGHIETTGESEVITALSKQFATDGYRFRSLLYTVVASASFRYAGIPQ